MACAHDVAFDANLVEDGGLAGWAPLGSRTALSVHVEHELQDPTRLPDVGREREHRPSGRYVLATRRDEAEDGLQYAVPAGALVPRVTYRVVGWVGVQGGGGGSHHAVRVGLRVDDDDGVDERRISWIDCGAACCTDAAGGWAEINGAFRLRAPCLRVAAVHVHGAPAGVDVKVMDLRVLATDRTARFRQLKEETDKESKGTWLGTQQNRDNKRSLNITSAKGTKPIQGIKTCFGSQLSSCSNQAPGLSPALAPSLQVRKRDVVLKFGGGAAASAASAASMSDASIRVVQLENRFPFGSCINKTAIQDPKFVDFFTDNFDWAVFENELKWYSTEPRRGQINYRDADELLEFCDRHGKPARGHCVFWAVDSNVQQWVKELDRGDLMSAVQGRLHGLLSRYHGRFRHYDVNNEMLHGRFYRDRLGDGVAALMFREAARLDPRAQLFVNDYNVLRANDPSATPEKYVELVAALRRGGAAVAGIGAQGHMDNPVVGQVIRAALDKMATAGLPIWITELDVSEPDVLLRADDLEVVLREAYAHPAVNGVMLWGFMQGHMWRQDAYLVDADGTVNEAGRRFIDLRREWRSEARGTVDADGHFRFRGFHGTYVAQVVTAAGEMLKKFTVEEGDTSLEVDMEI
ncbi:hypothetical protein GUJ93_ZPchr0005g15352 [Zizania palustris]|uniref:GH10 domain-containing protein n=1 Tax=Zizania palustris TaxID=103762 RepID=A0A8J5W0V9_ZIZPA|nr:hypothetical protein GUJ93_ZPchr0005g15352 [Zizania palustris]